MPRKITLEQEIAYLRALADTGNATLAAEWAGVSKSWTYKRRREDAAFEALCRRMVAAARVRIKEEALKGPSPLPSPSGGEGEDAATPLTPPLIAEPPRSTPPHPPPLRGSSLSRKGRGANGGAERELVVQTGKRVQVRRGRAREWTAETDRRFLGALASAKDLGIALSSAGVSATAAYRRRETWPPFARGWSEALACDDWEVLAWVPQCIAAMLDGVEQSAENPVRITSVAEVIRLYARDLGKRRGRPMR